MHSNINLSRYSRKGFDCVELKDIVKLLTHSRRCDKCEIYNELNSGLGRIERMNKLYDEAYEVHIENPHIRLKTIPLCNC